jgi:hypothetical protein
MKLSSSGLLAGLAASCAHAFAHGTPTAQHAADAKLSRLLAARRQASLYYVCSMHPAAVRAP